MEEMKIRMGGNDKGVCVCVSVCVCVCVRERETLGMESWRGMREGEGGM